MFSYDYYYSNFGSNLTVIKEQFLITYVALLKRKVLPKNNDDTPNTPM